MDRTIPAYDITRQPMPMSAPPSQRQFNFSPPEMDSAIHSDEFDDGAAGSDNEGDSFDQVDPVTGATRRSRRPPSTAEKRANHNAIERARRENLNVRFNELARALPNMNGNKRPSKNAIVLRSLEFVQSAKMREHALENQNAALRAEVNELRSKLGIRPLGPTRAGVEQVKQEHRAAKPHYIAAPVAQRQQPAGQGYQFGGSAAPGAIVDSGPYLPPADPIATASLHFPNYGFIDHRRPSLVSNGSGHESDSEASLVHTPPQPNGFGQGLHYSHDTAAPRGLVGGGGIGGGAGHVAPSIPGIGNFNNVNVSSCASATPAAPSWASVGGYGLSFPMYA